MTKGDDDHNIIKIKRQFADGRIGRREFLRYATALGLSAGAAYAFVGRIVGDSILPRAVAADMPKGGVLKIGMEGVPSVQDRNNGFGGFVASHTAEFLTKVDQNNVTHGMLLDSWEASDDLRSWTFHVRDGVTWRNGRAFTVDDVIWNLQYALDPNSGSSMISVMGSYLMNDDRSDIWDANAIERVDDSRVRLNLRIPQIAVATDMFHYAFNITDPEEGGIFQPGSNGTGAFELVEIEVNRKAVLKARSGYWGTGPYLDGLEYVDIAGDPAAQVAAFASKQIHGVFEGSLLALEPLKALPHIQIYEIGTATCPAANMRVDQEPFSDVRVRMAMKLAIDQERTLQLVMKGLGLVGEHHHISPIFPAYAKLNPIKQDIAKAKALLAEAGYPDGFEVDFAVPQTPAYCFLGAQVLAEQWKEVGVNCRIKVSPEIQFWDQAWPNEKLSMPYFYHRSIELMVLNLFFRSGGAWNVTRYANADYDRLLDEAAGLLDVDKRREVNAQLEQIMQDDGPSVQPIWISRFTFYDKRVMGFQMHPANYIFANELALQS